MLELYKEKHNLISQFYLITQDIEKMIEQQDLREEASMAALTKLVENRNDLSAKVDEVDKKIHSSSMPKDEIPKIKASQKAMEVLLKKTIEIDQKNQQELDKKLREISDELKQVHQQEKEIKAYAPIDNGAIHIDVTQ